MKTCGKPKTKIGGLTFCASCDGKPAQHADGSLTMSQRDVPRGKFPK